jgi:hypothetical protein
VIAIMGSILPETMRAVVFNGPFEVEVVDKPVPKILEKTDAILKVSATALCGSDLVRDPQSNLIFISQKSALQLP